MLVTMGYHVAKRQYLILEKREERKVALESCQSRKGGYRSVKQALISALDSNDNIDRTE